MFPNAASKAPLRLQLLQDGADCAHCPLAKHGAPHRPVGTEWLGKGRPAVAIVGEAPGKREVQNGRPFVGPSGRLLDYACGKGGVRRTDIAIMNAAACGPIPSLAEGMKRDATAACRPRLLTELRRLQPGTILAVGSFALRALAPSDVGGISTVRGALLPLADDVFPTEVSHVGLDLARDVPAHPAPGSGIALGSPTAGKMPPLMHAPLARGVELGPLPPIGSPEGEVRQGSVGGGNASKSAFSHFRPTELTPKPHFLATFHPAHILRGGDGDAPDSPSGESGPAVDLLFYFFLYDLAKAQRLARGEIKPWEDDLDLFAVREGHIVHPVFNDADQSAGWEFAAPNAFPEAMQRLVREAREAREFACDVETDALDAMRAGLTAIAAATHLGGIAATWSAWQADPYVLDQLRQLLRHSLIHKIFHNRIYDTIVLPRHGLPVEGYVDDTLLKHHAAFPGLPHKLQQVATQFFAVRPWKAEFRRTEKDEASLILYNGRDTVATARLSQALDKVIDSAATLARKLTLTRRVYETDRQQFAVATHMRQVGYYVDREEQARQSAVQHARLTYMRDALIQDFKAIEDRWRHALARILATTKRKNDTDDFMARVQVRYDEIAKRDQTDTNIGLFKPKAHKDMIALFEVLRIPVLDYTAKGAPKTDKKAMEAGAGRHPLLRKIIHLREAKHVLATYIDGLPILEDGRVHPDWSPKISGRWGAGKAQNIPKFMQGWPPEANPDGSFRTRPSGELICPTENARRQITAPTAAEVLRLPRHTVNIRTWLRAQQGHGRILVGADFSQLELRIAGYLSRDSFLLDIFRRDLDPHAAFAHKCFPKQMPQLEADFKGACEGILDGKGKPLKIKSVGAAADSLDALALDVSRRKAILVPALKWYRLRDLTKRAEYCGIYGGQAETVYDSIVKDFPEVQLKDLRTLIDDINRTMSGVVRWRNEQEGLARVNREIRETLIGRARHFPLGHFNPNIVYNFPIQAFAASLLAFGIFRFTALTHPELLQLDRLYEFGLLDPQWVGRMQAEGYGQWRAPCDLLINGHDSLLAECDEEDGDQGVRLLDMAMTQELPMGDEMMRFPADAAKGRRWSDT